LIVMAACGTGCTIPEHLGFVQWHLILGGFSLCSYFGTWILEVPARYLATLWTADYWFVPIMVQPSASGCFYLLQTTETRQTIYGHLALQALSCEQYIPLVIAVLIEGISLCIFDALKTIPMWAWYDSLWGASCNEICPV